MRLASYIAIIYLKRAFGQVFFVVRLLLVVDEHILEEDEEAPVEDDVGVRLLVHVARVDGGGQVQALQ